LKEDLKALNNEKKELSTNINKIIKRKEMSFVKTNNLVNSSFTRSSNFLSPLCKLNNKNSGMNLYHFKYCDKKYLK